MSEPMRILILCGTSVATATLAEVKVKNEAVRRKVAIKTYKGKITDGGSLVKSMKPDVVIATAMSEELKKLAQTGTFKLFSGVPLITGIGVKELMDQLFTTTPESK